ncbi:MAG: HEAT repeat domain-containing protein [Deltaproteobacteria bacterium]|nr:HEAT repeat domain-containing protein [Deltaproteobacteria bacterium]
MRNLVPSSSIIDDLLAENWELRWQVLKTLQQTQLMLQGFARSSREYKQAQALCREMAGRVNGPSDVNLHLVLAAVWFLGGNHFLLLALEKIGVDDPEINNNEIARIKKPLSGNHPEASFFDYFYSLLSRNQAVDASLATAIKIFPPDVTLNLLLSIPEPEIRSSALSQFKKQFPETFFNDQLLKNDFALIKENPQLFDFIGAPLKPEIKAEFDNLTGRLLAADSPAVDPAVRAAGRLQLTGCKSQLNTLLEEVPAAAGALARLKDPNGYNKLIQSGKSWRRKKRAATLSDLAWCHTPEALAILQKSARQGHIEERRTALNTLGNMRTPEALQILYMILKKTSKEKELNLIFQALAGSKWPGENRMIADFLSQWSDQIEFYPQILQALAALDYSDKWAKILEQTTSPVLKPHYREIALFMCRYADRYEIRRKLLSLTSDIDWSFSYRLLTLIATQLKSSDINTLLNLLKDRDEKRELTIKERLTKGQDLEKIDDALAEFFQQHPEIANLSIEKVVTLAITASTPNHSELFTLLQQQPADLIELMLGPGNTGIDNENSDQRDFPLLLTMHLLAEIKVDGSDCFALVVNRTRRYSGFFRQTIIATLNRLLETEGELDNTSSLPHLNLIINAIRKQPHFSGLRDRILERINHITRNSSELLVFNEASQTRELRVLKVRKITA